MKNAAIVLALFCCMTNLTYAGVNPDLKKEITKKLKLDLSTIHLNQNDRDYVMVSFKIENSEIIIQEIEGSQKLIKEKMISELKKMRIDSIYEEGKVYQYHFTFKTQ